MCLNSVPLLAQKVALRHWRWHWLESACSWSLSWRRQRHGGDVCAAQRKTIRIETTRRTTTILYILSSYWHLQPYGCRLQTNNGKTSLFQTLFNCLFQISDGLNPSLHCEHRLLPRHLGKMRALSLERWIRWQSSRGPLMILRTGKMTAVVSDLVLTLV